MNKYSKLQIALKYTGYLLRASNGKGHGTHSPFIFNFITKVLNDHRLYADYKKAEALRSQLSQDHTVINVEDFGAGASNGSIKQRSISSIAINSAKPEKYGRLLYRMVKNYQPDTIVEMGTSLGITTSYLSLAQSDAKVVTMEGAAEVAKKAIRNFESLGLRNVSLVTGNFNTTLPEFLDRIGTLDFVFIDGNHRKEPTERYFRQLIPKMHRNSVLVFDDIHWSKEMEQAWESIKEHPAVLCTVDLFFIGIVFFREEFREKQDFTIRF